MFIRLIQAVQELFVRSSKEHQCILMFYYPGCCFV